MNIVLPNKRDGLNELISKIDSTLLRRAQVSMGKVELAVSLPKFKFTNTIQLNQVLKDVSIFTSTLNLSIFYEKHSRIFSKYIFSLDFDKYSQFKHRFHNWHAVLSFKIVLKCQMCCKKRASKSMRKEVQHSQQLKLR